ncbi:leucine-rich repeat extensin-like protein 6 [Hibiscus syriacus]|uniref:leucine-rich repeat extensin-like protein 6 n=1 Tax=Hibiscus syriacus TaxID=106335 RepID=UPI0019209244|nr:leucine-rich repeat extensin-like protein 6 [Hibiscus syriacus]
MQPPPVTYPPPSQTGALYPSPTGNLPYFPPPPPPPPYGNLLNGQPSPDSIMPYFPYYYRKPPHQTEDQSSTTTTTIGKPSMVMMIATAYLGITSKLNN